MSHKTIKLFEAFAGIGSQYQALKNIKDEKKWTIEPVGLIEWYIPAIVAYELIHYQPISKSKYIDNIYIYIYIW